MLTIEKALTLGRVDLFSGLAGESLAEIAAVAEETELAAGQRIDATDEPGRAMYVVATGRVQVGDGNGAPTYGPGEAFGERYALDPGEGNDPVTAREDSLLLRIDHENLFDLIAEDPALAKTIIRSLCRRLGKGDRAA